MLSTNSYNFLRSHTHIQHRRESGRCVNRAFLYLVTIVSPRSPLHIAALHIEREILDVYITGASEDAMTQPDDLPAGSDDDIRVDYSRVILGIRAGNVPQRKQC
jgi:hypothetical protein